LAKETAWLFAVVALSAILASAEEQSSQWTIIYKVLGDCPDDRTAAFGEGGILYMEEDESTLHGSSSLGSRGDGFMIGTAMDCRFDAAITFHQSPLLFIRLKGERSGDALSGRFTASSSDGRFWWGDFAASPSLPSGSCDPLSNGKSITMPDAGPAPRPLRFADPEAFWSNQTGTEVRPFFVITYDRDTILMCRNVPMIWQWWL